LLNLKPPTDKESKKSLNLKAPNNIEMNDKLIRNSVNESINTVKDKKLKIDEIKIFSETNSQEFGDLNQVEMLHKLIQINNKLVNQSQLINDKLNKDNSEFNELLHDTIGTIKT